MHKPSNCPGCSNGEIRQKAIGEKLIEKFPDDVVAAIASSPCSVIRCTYCGLVYIKDGSVIHSKLGYWNSEIRGPGFRSLQGG